jgi:hypothetical protein
LSDDQIADTAHGAVGGEVEHVAAIFPVEYYIVAGAIGEDEGVRPGTPSQLVAAGPAIQNIIPI